MDRAEAEVSTFGGTTSVCRETQSYCMSAQSKLLVEATERSRVEVNTTSWTQGVRCDTLLNLSR